MKKFIITIFIIFAYSINIPYTMAGFIRNDKSGGWVFSETTYRYPTPQAIKYRIDGDLSLTPYFTDKKVKELLEQAMAKIEKITNVLFIQSNDLSVLVIKKDPKIKDGSIADSCIINRINTFPNCKNHKSGAILINSNADIARDLQQSLKYYNVDNTDTNKDIYLRRLWMHELGHILGFDHVRAHNRLLNSGNILFKDELDTHPSSIMFINLAVAKDSGATWNDAKKYSRADRIALIKMYGASPVYTSYLANNTAKTTALKNEL